MVLSSCTKIKTATHFEPEIFLRRKLDALKEEEREAELEKSSAQFLKQMDPAIGVQQGYIDEVIEPGQTRAKLLAAFKEAGVF